MDPATLFAYAAFAFLLAGTIKGIVGIGLPTTAMGLLTLAVDPRMAIALILIPMLLANAWQVFRAGHLMRTARRYLPFAATLFAGVGITVMLARDVADHWLLGSLGVAMLLFVAVNVTKWAPKIPETHDTRAQVVAGSIAGLMGGLTSVWGPPMAVYLAARQTGKDEFVRATGFLIFIGSLPLIVGYLRQGYLTGQLALLSFALLIPTFAGFALGERLRHRMSEYAFRNALLALFALMGLNLIRRAFM